MGNVTAAMPSTLLEQPVFDAGGDQVGRVGAIGMRRGSLRHLGVEHGTDLHFVGIGEFTVERDRVVLTG